MAEALVMEDSSPVWPRIMRGSPDMLVRLCNKLLLHTSGQSMMGVSVFGDRRREQLKVRSELWLRAPTSQEDSGVNVDASSWNDVVWNFCGCDILESDDRI